MCTDNSCVTTSYDMLKRQSHGCNQSSTRRSSSSSTR